MQRAVRPKPVAARLAMSRLGPLARPPSASARSSTNPVEGSDCSQKYMTARFSMSSKKTRSGADKASGALAEAPVDETITPARNKAAAVAKQWTQILKAFDN